MGVSKKGQPNERPPPDSWTIAGRDRWTDHPASHRIPGDRTSLWRWRGGSLSVFMDEVTMTSGQTNEQRGGGEEEEEFHLRLDWAFPSVPGLVGLSTASDVE